MANQSGPLQNKIKLRFGMHPQLINMDFEVVMVIKGIQYMHLHLHAPKLLHGVM